MENSNKLKILFFINPVSGGTNKTALENEIKTYFQSGSHMVELIHLNGHHDEIIIQQGIEHHKPDRVVAVGGDGTVKFVAQQLLGTGIPLGILPAGSANGMARELELPTDTIAQLDTILNGHSKAIDTIHINNELCLHLSDIGLNAQLVKYYAENGWRGKFGYLRGAVRALYRKRLLRVDIQSEGKELHVAAFMVVIANARMYGTGAIINPEGELADGAFEVIILRTLSFWEILKMFWRYQPFDPKKIHIFPATSVKIQTRRRAYFQVDGEYKGKVKEVEARIRMGELQVMLPGKQV